MRLVHLATELASAPIDHPAVEIASPLASKINGHGLTQYALHVTDYYCMAALANLRAMGACSRKTRTLTDDEFDHNQFNIENGDTGIY